MNTLEHFSGHRGTLGFLVLGSCHQIDIFSDGGCSDCSCNGRLPSSGPGAGVGAFTSAVMYLDPPLGGRRRHPGASRPGSGGPKGRRPPKQTKLQRPSRTTCLTIARLLHPSSPVPTHKHSHTHRSIFDSSARNRLALRLFVFPGQFQTRRCGRTL